MSEPGTMKIESPLVQIDVTRLNKASGVQITESLFHGHLNLRGRPDNAAFMNAVSDVLGCKLPLDANTYTVTDELKIYWLGPDEWLIVTLPDQQAELETKLRAALSGIFSSINDVSSGQTIITISGSNARRLLEKGCTLDFHPCVFKVGDCAQTLLAKTGILISQTDDESSYEVIVRRSFSDYLGLWLLDAVE